MPSVRTTYPLNWVWMSLKAYDYVQKMWSKQKELVKAKVKSYENEIREKPDDSK